MLSNLRRDFVGEGNRSVVDGEVGGIEDDEFSVSDDVDVDGDRAAEFAGCEVRCQANVIPFRHCEFWETRLSFEFLHFYLSLFFFSNFLEQFFRVEKC